MRSIRMWVIASVAAIALSGCSTLGGGGGSVDLDAFIKAVQANAKQVCSFVPLASDIANMVGGGNPIVGSAVDVANQICDAVNRTVASGRRRAGGTLTVVVNGKPIRGTLQ